MATGNRFPQQRGGQMGGIIGIIVMAVVVIGLFFVVRGIFNLLYFLAPVLLIATLIIDYKIVLNYLKQLVGLFKTNPLYGLGATAFTFFLYPIVFLVLLFRAVTGKGRKRIFTAGGNSDENAEYAEYEEIDDDLDLGLDLDELGRVKEKQYGKYFKEE